MSRTGYVYATPEVKQMRAYKRAVELEMDVAPRGWSDPNVSIDDLEVLADAWEEAGFLGWADNYRAEVAHRIRRTARDARRSRSTHPTRRQREFISHKISILRREGYPQRQAIAIAHRMAGVPSRSRSAGRA